MGIGQTWRIICVTGHRPSQTSLSARARLHPDFVIEGGAPMQTLCSHATLPLRCLPEDFSPFSGGALGSWDSGFGYSIGILSRRTVARATTRCRDPAEIFCELCSIVRLQQQIAPPRSNRSKRNSSSVLKLTCRYGTLFSLQHLLYGSSSITASKSCARERDR